MEHVKDAHMYIVHLWKIFRTEYETGTFEFEIECSIFKLSESVVPHTCT